MIIKFIKVVCLFVVLTLGCSFVFIGRTYADSCSNLSCAGPDAYNDPKCCNHPVCGTSDFKIDCTVPCSNCITGVENDFPGKYCENGCCWLDSRTGDTGCVKDKPAPGCNCVAPSGIVWVSPGSNAVIGKGSVLTWSNASRWGSFQNCETAGTGSYQIWVKGTNTNITGYCKEGSTGNIVQPTNTCTLIDVPSGWTSGAYIEFEIRASNGECSSTGITRTFKITSPPVIESVQVSKDGITFHDHCGSFSTSATCETNNLCIWNSIKNRCQAYINNGKSGGGRLFSTYKVNSEVYVQNHITDPDGVSDLASLGFYLDSADQSQPSRPLLNSVSRNRYDNGMLLLKDIYNYGNGVWVLRGLGYIGTDPNLACNCGIADGIVKNCDGSSTGSTCSSLSSPRDCTGSCNWNYVYGYCQPVGGCVDNYRSHPWRIGVETVNSTHWNTGVIGTNGSDYTICSLGGVNGSIDLAKNGECITGGISGRVTAQTISTNGYITNRYKSVSDDSAKLFYRIHVNDKFAMKEVKNAGNWTMIGGSGICTWGVSGGVSSWLCGKPGALNVYVDNSMPSGSITVSTEDLLQGSIKLEFNVSDAVIGGDGGGLRSGFDANLSNGVKGIDNLRVQVNSGGVQNIASAGLSVNSTTCNLLNSGTVNNFECEVVVGGLSGGTSYQFFANITDLAGNTREISQSFYYAGPWFETLQGDLYSRGPITNIVPSLTPSKFTSTYLLFSGTSSIDASSSKSWLISNYNDANGEIDWYVSLSEIVEINTGIQFEVLPSISNIELLNSQYDTVFRNTSDFALSSVTCAGKKVVFVGGDLNVTGNVDVTGDVQNGCLFIVEGDLIVENSVTSISAGFIVNGNVVIKNSYDPLTVTGFLFSSGQIKMDTTDTSCNGKCGRDLFVTNNLLSPSERFIYDPRYIDIMRDFLGRKKIENFTCGTVDREECY